MVHESVKGGVPIALCFLPEGSQQIRPVAGYAIPQIVEERPDRSLLIFMAGQGRVILEPQTLRAEGSFSSMRGVLMKESLELSDRYREKYVTLGEALVRWVSQHITDQLQKEIFVKSLIGPREVVGAFTAYLIYDYDLQYEVMELKSMDQQIEFLYRLLLSGRLTNV